MKKLAVIGGGAAGFFAAITAKAQYPQLEVLLFERSGKALSKVRISGGGRCNVTSATRSISELAKAYPRGGKALKKLLPRFSTPDIMDWFQRRGVGLVTESDGRVFPDTHRSSTIIDCMMEEVKKLGIRLETRKGVEELKPLEDGFELRFKKGEKERFDQVIVATGGSPKRRGLEWLEALGHKIEDPVPSLFTFNMPGDSLTELSGISVEDAIVSVQGSKLKAQGPLLITHQGMSGPAILKVSAFGARILYDRNYRFQLQINWVGGRNELDVMNELRSTRKDHSKKQMKNLPPFELPERLWKHLLERAGVSAMKPWAELGKKESNRLADRLTRDVHEVNGKSTYKEEFVTCGGVSWESVDAHTMESKACPGLYFAGEVLDVDAITGGYNFQAAWTTGYVAGLLEGS